MKVRAVVGWFAMGVMGVGCQPAPDPELAARSCLDVAVASLGAPPSPEDHEDLTCADPFGTARCRAAWHDASEHPGDAGFEAAVAACRPSMCARPAAAGLRLCVDAANGSGFAARLAWFEVFRAVLEPELGRERALALIGLWQGLTQPQERPGFSTSP